MALRIEAAPVALPPPVPVAPAEPAAPVRANPPYLLLADDDHAEAAALAELLQKQAIACDVVNSAGDALAAFMARDYDMILMNLRAPIQAGLDATARIRQLERSFPEPRVPIFILATDVSEQERKFAKNAQVDDVLERTRDVADLAAIVERTFEVERRTPQEMIPREALQYVRLLADAGGNDAAAQARGGEFAGLLAKAVETIRAAIAAGDLGAIHSAANGIKEHAIAFGSGRVRRTCTLISRLSAAAHIADQGVELLGQLEATQRDLEAWQRLGLGRVHFQTKVVQAAAQAAPRQRTAVKIFSFLKNREDVFSKAQ